MNKEIPVVDLQGDWSITPDINFAMVNNYIGEDYLKLKGAHKAVASVLNRRYFEGWIYYYGTRDEYLSKKFGYND